MRKGILSLIMPNSRRKKSGNILKAEKATATVAKPVIQEPLPAAAPEEKPFVQKIYVPKTPSLLKAVTKKHDEMARRTHLPPTT